MTAVHARQVRLGDVVHYQGRLARVEGIVVSGIAAPLFRLTDADTGAFLGLTSYRLCRLAQ